MSAPRIKRIKPDWTALRLRDRARPNPRVLFVGINPGVRSAVTGHHFAGYSNRFWNLLHESGLVPEPLTAEDDDRLPEWGYAVTNLIARPSPGIDDLKPQEYVEGWAVLNRKIARLRPSIVAFIGVTLYRAVLPLVSGAERGATRRGRRSVLGACPLVVHGARIFVLPNPSGRNANYSYAEMLAAFRVLARAVRRLPPPRPCT